MIKVIRRMEKKIKLGMQQNYLTFRLLVWMDQCGIARKVGFWERYVEDKKLRIEPSQEMLKSREFYEMNQSRVTNLMSMLADKKSRIVWEGL